MYSCLPSASRERKVKEATNSLDVIKLLLVECPSLLSSKNKKGKNPLHSACEKGNIEAVKCLFDLGANINAQGWGDTPLHIAARYRHDDIVSFLLDKGADFTIKTLTGYTILHEAAISGSLVMLNYNYDVILVISCHPGNMAIFLSYLYLSYTLLHIILIDPQTNTITPFPS